MFLFVFKNLLNTIGCITLSIRTGYLSTNVFGRVGLFSKPPPQLGQTFSKIVSTHSLQNVHSNVQIIASLESWGKNKEKNSQQGQNNTTIICLGG